MSIRVHPAGITVTGLNLTTGTLSQGLGSCLIRQQSRSKVLSICVDSGLTLWTAKTVLPRSHVVRWINIVQDLHWILTWNSLISVFRFERAKTMWIVSSYPTIVSFLHPHSALHPPWLAMTWNIVTFEVSNVELSALKGVLSTLRREDSSVLWPEFSPLRRLLYNKEHRISGHIGMLSCVKRIDLTTSSFCHNWGSFRFCSTSQRARCCSCERDIEWNRVCIAFSPQTGCIWYACIIATLYDRFRVGTGTEDLYIYKLWFVDYVFSKPGALLHINNYVCSLPSRSFYLSVNIFFFSLLVLGWSFDPILHKSFP